MNNISEVLFTTTAGTSPFTRNATTLMSYHKQPQSLESLRCALRENRRILATHTDGRHGIVTRLESDYVNVDTKGEFKTWYWSDLKGFVVCSEITLTPELIDFVNAYAGDPTKHILVRDGKGDTFSTNMSYVKYHKDTGQIFMQDSSDGRVYYGHDFIFENVDLVEHQINMLKRHAQEWMAHKNPFEPGDVVCSNPAGIEMAVVVSVYPQEIDGTKYYDMDIVIGDFGMPKPVHSYLFKKYQSEKKDD